MYYHKMSLIVLSNTQEHYDREVDGVLTNDKTGVQQPYSFHNHLSNTITIPPHAEIAIIDAKIKRNIVFDVKKNVILYWFFGERLSDTVSFEDTTGLDTPVRIQAGYYTWGAFQTEIQRAITEAMTHPNFTLNACSVGSDGAIRLNYTMICECTGSDIKAGYENTANFVGVGASNLAQKLMGASVAVLPAVSPDGQVEPSAGGPSIHYGGNGSPGNNEVIRDAVTPTADIWDNRADLILTDLPMNMVTQKHAGNGPGGLALNFANAHDAPMTFNDDGGWIVGLTRPVLNDIGIPYFVDSTHEDGADGGDFIGNSGGTYGKGHYDYAVVFSNAPAYNNLDGSVEAEGWGIDLYQSEWNPWMNLTRMKRIQYWGADIVALVGTATATRITDAQMANTGAGAGGIYANLHIYFKNEGFTVVLRDGANVDNTGVTLMASANTDWAALPKNTHRCFKPTGITTQALYPRFNISERTKYFTIQQIDACAPIARRSGGAGVTGVQKSYDYPNMDDVAEIEWKGGSSFFGRCYLNARNMGRALEVDSRPAYNPYDGLDPKVYLTQAAGTPQSPNYHMGLITQPSPAYWSTSYDYGYTNISSGTAGLLGFGPDSYGGNVINASSDGSAQITSSLDHNRAGGVTTSIDGGTNYAGGGRGKWVLNGGQPNYNPSQLYIKSTTFTHQSYNFNKGLPSKILWTVPRFTNEGRDWGNLSFQNSNPVYLCLNNPNPVVLNDISIELCDKNETLALDLGGVTEISLHIKQK